MTDNLAPLPPDDLTREVTIVHADDPGLTHLGIGAGTYTILVSGAQTGGAYTLIDMLVPQGGPPPHRHEFEEMFYVLEGEVDFTFRGEVHRVGPGHAVNIPANAPHVFRVASVMPARLLCLCLPAGQEDFFRLAGEPLPSRAASPTPPTPERLTELRGLLVANALRYRSEFVAVA